VRQKPYLVDFLGNPYARIHGPQVALHSIPLLDQVPFFGPVFFSHNIPVYLSLALIGLAWWYIYRTPLGLQLRSVGEHPQAAFARGIAPRRLQLFYAVCGGMLVGLAGATFSLSTKQGWGRPQGAEGTGWIALALVIFGGWNPVKAALGAYLFSFLQILGIYFQGWLPSIPAQVFQVAPFPLMIFTLVLMHLAQKESILSWAESSDFKKSLLRIFAGTAPAALGKPHRTD
jgi:ABC-type uncharacterized transport system permease subunit